MKMLVLGKRSLVAQSLLATLRARAIPFEHLSYAEVKSQPTAFFASFSHVINCIAYTAVDQAQSHPTEAYAINAEFVGYLASVVSKLIHYSTDYIFDGNSPVMYDEKSKPHPLNVYGASKLAGEEKALQAGALVIRPSWIYGPGKENFVTTLVKRMMESEDIPVVADQISRCTYAVDLAEATLDLLEQEGVVHFANEGVLSRYEWAQAIWKQLERLGAPLRVKKLTPVPATHFAMPAPRPAFSPLSTAKYQQLTGKKPRPYTAALSDYFERGERW